jgi:two-component system chemotaxis response regulator CheY
MKNTTPRRLKILLVDDDREFRDMVRACLESAGHAVVEASDGIGALKLFAATHPDLVVTDVVMPDRDGLSTIMEIKKTNLNTKIIVVSGDGRMMPPSHYLNVARHLGADRTLPKPLDLDLLLTVVEGFAI